MNNFLKKGTITTLMVFVFLGFFGCERNQKVNKLDGKWGVYENQKIGISVEVPKNALVDYRRNHEFNIAAVVFSEGPIEEIVTWLLYYGDTNKSYQNRVESYRDEIAASQAENKSEKKTYKEIDINGKIAFVEFIEKGDVFYVEAVRIPIDEKRFGHIRFGCEKIDCMLHQMHPQVLEGSNEERMEEYSNIISNLIISID